MTGKALTVNPQLEDVYLNLFRFANLIKIWFSKNRFVHFSWLYSRSLCEGSRRQKKAFDSMINDVESQNRADVMSHQQQHSGNPGESVCEVRPEEI